MATTTKAKALTRSELTEALEAQIHGKPMPSGVTYSAYRFPQYLSVDEQAAFDRDGRMPESALSRAGDEATLMADLVAKRNKEIEDLRGELSAQTLAAQEAAAEAAKAAAETTPTGTP